MTPSSTPPGACPHCGAPAETMLGKHTGKLMARCGGNQVDLATSCNPNWMPLTDWNDPTRRGGAEERPACTCQGFYRNPNCPQHHNGMLAGMRGALTVLSA